MFLCVFIAVNVRSRPCKPDGARVAQGVRSDARAALCGVDGLVRQWRRLLSLVLLSRARMRSHCASRHLRARLPTNGRGIAVRHVAAAEENWAQH